MFRKFGEGLFEHEDLYDCSEINVLINHYIENDGNIETAWEGTLGYGRILLTAPELKPCVVTEVYLTPWTSAHRVELYDSYDDIPDEVLQQIEDFILEEEETYSWQNA